MKLFAESHEIHPMSIVAYCLMPNHFHLVLWPREDGEVSRWMQWIQTTHVRRYHRHYDTSGHVWQGRFKAFPIQHDAHLLTVLRYVERNPFRAGLTPGVGDRAWSSLSLHGTPKANRPGWLSEGPVRRGADWLRHVAAPQTEAELVAVRRSVERGTPFGGDRWQRRVATALGLESTLRPRGRPRKSPPPQP